MKRALIGALTLFVMGCGDTTPGYTNADEFPRLLGQEITVTGRPENRKVGPVLVMKRGEVWVLGLDRWPDDSDAFGGDGKVITATGRLTEAHDLPVFIPKEGEPIISGIPVPEGTDLKQASHRYLLLLRTRRWTVTDE